LKYGCSYVNHLLLPLQRTERERERERERVRGWEGRREVEPGRKNVREGCGEVVRNSAFE
jgi:hypothetical protein